MPDLHEPAQGRRSEPIVARAAAAEPMSPGSLGRRVDPGLIAMILLIGVPLLLYCVLSAAR